MKLGICNTTYTNTYGVEPGYKKMKAHGYDFADFQQFINTETDFFKSPASKFEKALMKENGAAKAAGILFSQTHGPWRYPPNDYTQETRAERMESMKKSIYGTAVLGCNNFVIHPIMPFGADSSESPDEMIEINFEFFSKLCDYAKTLGIIVCFENMPFVHSPLARTTDIIKFVKKLNRDNFRICLDTGHCAVFGDSPADAVRIMGSDLLATLHVHDNDGLGDKHWRPREGVIDWEDFSKALSDIGYNGVFSLECAPLRVKDAPETWKTKELELAAIAKKLAGN
ncbi:MAG: sugar phosphate isomerase/epimerase [Clostridia bacterium]|nr:sugar phosphate isomerase/epimerase [Clostridia bacterium]